MINDRKKSKPRCIYFVSFLLTVAVAATLSAQTPQGDFEANNSIVGQSNYLRYQQQLPAQLSQQQNRAGQPRMLAVQQAIARLNTETQESTGSNQVQPMVQPAAFQQPVDGHAVSENPNTGQPPSSPGSKRQKQPESLIGFINQVLPSRNRSTTSQFNPNSQQNPGTGQEFSPTEQATRFTMRSGNENPLSETAGAPFGQPASTAQPASDVERIDLQSILKRIGISTAIVLASCVVFLLVAKKFGFGIGQNNSIGSISNPGSRINVIETKKLSSRCLLKLVEIDDAQFVVAEDSSGVKFVEPINKPFSAALDDIEPQAESKHSRDEDLTPAQTSQLASLISRL